jgi:hypothetical protein
MIHIRLRSDIKVKKSDLYENTKNNCKPSACGEVRIGGDELKDVLDDLVGQVLYGAAQLHRWGHPHLQHTARSRQNHHWKIHRTIRQLKD